MPESTHPIRPRKNPAKPPSLGADVAMRWRGELHAARFFAMPREVSLGPDGDFPLPPELLAPPDDPGGLPRRVTLVQPHGAGVALRLDVPAVQGIVITGTHAVTLADLRAGKVAFVGGQLVPLALDSRVDLAIGEFTFTIRIAPVPEKPRWRPRLAPDTPALLLCWLLAAAILAGPLLLGQPQPRTPVPPRSAAQGPQPIEVEIEEEPAEDEPMEEPAEDEKPERREETPPLRKVQPPPKVPGVLYERREEPAPRRESHAVPATPDEKAAVRRAVTETLAQLDPAAARVVPQLGAHLQPGDQPTGKPGAEGPDPDAEMPSRRQRGLDAGDPPEVAAVKESDATEVHLDVHAPPPQKVAKIQRLPPGPKTPALPPRVRDVIAQHRGAVRACFQKGLQLQPDLAGRVVVEFVIEGGGHVVSARPGAGTVMADEAVTACVVAVLHGLRFPMAEDGQPVKIAYPFTFQPR